ncbi:MAG: hypothetical protein NC923_05950 [Candidatus Omnitrophica bacterium]|nr:hypothetical protein [Candidatus Omnitrophota bacterium]
MVRFKKEERGVVLVLVVGILIVVTLLIGAILSILASQYRFTHHKISRIQAYYVAFAGLNYAVEMLRQGVWSGCDSGVTYTLNDNTFPSSIVNKNVTIVVYCPQFTDNTAPCYYPPENSTCISATVNYTYTSP